MHVLQRRIYNIFQWVSTSFSIGQLRLPGDPILPKLRKGGGSGGGVLTPLPFPPLCSSPVLKRWDAWETVDSNFLRSESYRSAAGSLTESSTYVPKRVQITNVVDFSFFFLLLLSIKFFSDVVDSTPPSPVTRTCN